MPLRSAPTGQRRDVAAVSALRRWRRGQRELLRDLTPVGHRRFQCPLCDRKGHPRRRAVLLSSLPVSEPERKRHDPCVQWGAVPLHHHLPPPCVPVPPPLLRHPSHLTPT